MAINNDLPMGIREKILQKTYTQCLQLIKPETREYERHVKDGHLTPPTGQDLCALTMNGGAMLYNVQIGTFPLMNYRNLSLLPALYIADGDDPEEDTSSRNQQLGSATLSEVFETYPLTLRVVVRQPLDPKPDQSNPIRLARIREQLDYFLDMQAFGGIIDRDRVGYRSPSKVYRALITTQQTLKGFASPWEIVDFNFIAIFQRQYART